MNKFKTLCKANNLEISGRRYSLSQLISESYQTLYSCSLDSPLYKLTESHIEDLRRNPTQITRLSYDLEVLKGLSKLGESAKIMEDAEMTELEDEDVINEDADMETLDDEDVINEDADMETLDDEDVINEDADMETLDDEDVINEDADMTELEDEDVINEEFDPDVDTEEDEGEITPEELQELKKHLKEIRKAARRARECDMHDPENAEDPERMKMTGKFAESRTWKSEKNSMTKALKNFRESSNKKAFFKSFMKLQGRMKSGNPLTIQESILLYKASNSTMTHLAVELEHNPGFIYTFKECTSMLARDNDQLLECIRTQQSPSKSLVESYRTFTSILLESEDIDDEITDEEEEVLMDAELEETPVEEPVVVEEPVPDEEIQESEEDEEIAPPENLEDEELPVEETEEPVIEEPSPEVDTPVEEPVIDEPLEEDEDDLDSEITDEEAEELRKKLAEIRGRK